MDNKTLSIVSYITFIGWLISFFSHKDKTPKSSLVIYHLKQSFGLIVLGFIYGIIVNIVAMAVPSLGLILSTASLLILVLLIFGIINAANEVEKPVPVVGAMFEDKFNFIK